MKLFGLKILMNRRYSALVKELKTLRDEKGIEEYTASLEILDDKYGQDFLKDEYVQDIKRESEWKLKELGRRLAESVKNNKRAAKMLRNMIRQNKTLEERMFDLGYFE